MKEDAPSRKSTRLSDQRMMLLVTLGWLVAMTAVSVIAARQYDFHRDELDLIDNARHLDWSFVEYPPVAPLITWIGLKLFGPSVIGLHLVAALAICGAIYLTGLMTQELGGPRRAQLLAMLATATTPIPIFLPFFLSYQTFDYLWWVLTAYLIIRLLKSDDPRWWLPIGATIGIGMMTKYTIAYFVVGIVAGVLLTPARRYLKSAWLWGGVGLAILIFVPNILWQVQHDFISLDFTTSIHARDVAIGRTKDFVIGQLYTCASLAALPLWLAGLWYYFQDPQGRKYRLLGWAFIMTFLLFLVSQGRSYYVAPAYPMLFAGGASLLEKRWESSPGRRTNLWRGLVYGGLVLVGVVMLALLLPLAPINSGWWKAAVAVNGEMREEVGWQELAQEVARIRDMLPAEDLPRLGIFAGNYGEAGAINLYREAYGLPEAISGTNTYWLRGFGDPPPETLIVIGETQKDLEPTFESCVLAGHTWNRYAVENEETTRHPDIFVCRGLKAPLKDIWKDALGFG
jgi:4-amino-4-deoxy-L-arabinose transferase-like glycosyltransferase